MADTQSHDAPAARAHSVRIPGHLVLSGTAAFAGEAGDPRPAQAMLAQGLEHLRAGDPALYALAAREHRRQAHTLDMGAEGGVVDSALPACAGAVFLGLTASDAGGPGQAGRELADEVERLAAGRARRAFGARHATVLPHGAAADVRQVVRALARPGETVLAPDAGGALAADGEATGAGNWFRVVTYGTDGDGRIVMEQVRRLAVRHRPRWIVARSTGPRAPDFRAFRRVADETGAWLLADVSEVAGLVAAGEHPSPVEHAHLTFAGSGGVVRGARGGVMLAGHDLDAAATHALVPDRVPVAEAASTAAALARVETPEFRALARRATAAARALAAALEARGYRPVSGGTDTHRVWLDVAPRGLTGAGVQSALQACGVAVDPSDAPGLVALGTASMAGRGMGAAEMEACAALLDDVLRAVRPLGEGAFTLAPGVAERAREQVVALCARYPLPGHAAAPAAARGDAAPARVVTPFDPYALPVDEPA